MTNLTIDVEEEILQEAQRRAKARGRSVEELVREYLKRLADEERLADETLSDQRKAIESIDALAERLSTDRGEDDGGRGRRWTREELYER